VLQALKRQKQEEYELELLFAEKIDIANHQASAVELEATDSQVTGQSSSDQPHNRNITSDMNTPVVTRASRKKKEDSRKRTQSLLSKSAGWDNVQIEEHKKHQSENEQNKMHMWAMCFFFDHRTPSLHLDESLRSWALSLSPYKFLPSPSDIEYIRQMCLLVTEQTLVSFIPALQVLSAEVQWHLTHEYSEEMAKKSVVHNISVIEANPSTTSGTIDICEHLQKYIPVVGETTHKIPCNVDQMSHERMTHSKRARTTCNDQLSQIKPLVENPQEFHKSGIVMQVRLKYVCVLFVNVF